MRASIIGLCLSLCLTACASRTTIRRIPPTRSYSQSSSLSQPNVAAPRQEWQASRPSALSFEQTVHLTQSSSPEEAIVTLDRHPLEFPLTAENFSRLEQAQVHPDVLDYLQKRASIDWNSLHADELDLQASPGQLADSDASPSYGIPVERPLQSTPSSSFSSVENGSLFDPRETRTVTWANGEVVESQTYYGQNQYGQTYYGTAAGTPVFGQTCRPSYSSYSNNCEGRRTVIISGPSPVVVRRPVTVIQVGAPVYQPRYYGTPVYGQTVIRPGCSPAPVVRYSSRPTYVVRHPSVNRQINSRSLTGRRR